MPWMVAPLARWLRPFLISDAGFESSLNLDFIEGLEMATRLRERLDRRDVVSDVEHRLETVPMFGIDAVAYALSGIRVVRSPTHGRTFPWAEDLNRILHQSGSAWEVTELDVEDGEEGEKELILTRRDLAAAKLAISDIRSQDARAGTFLADAWKAIASREPQPGEGYSKAVMAIEAAAQPVITPNNAKATLGRIIQAMEDKPEKWTFALGDLDLVIAIAQRVWGTHYRHGTQMRDDHTLEEADAALHLAIPLVRFFAGGLVVLNGS
jgi:hypothetical protein